jgi:hypothetical protein
MARTLRIAGLVAAWLAGLAAVALVTYLVWIGTAAAIGLVVPGDGAAVQLIPAALISLVPIGWYVWVTIVEPIWIGRRT